jgi:hypothetical protein
MKTVIQTHGCGYGDDGPLLTPKFQGDHLRNLRIEKGNAFLWKPVAMMADKRIQFVLGRTRSRDRQRRRTVIQAFSRDDFDCLDRKTRDPTAPSSLGLHSILTHG